MTRISESCREQYPSVPWHQMYGIRNIIAHAYIKVDNEIIRNTIEKDIPELKTILEKVIR